MEEHSDWLWVSKPAGLSCFPLHHHPDAPCVLSWLLSCFPEQDRPFPEGFRGGIAHRLDRSTSGLLWVARSPSALEHIRSLFRSGQLRKRYQLLTARSVPWTEHQIELPLAHHPRRKSRMVPQRGRSTPHRGRWYPASTQLKQLDRWRWRAEIQTGVMHQIRVHAASAGLALAGDHLYGGGRLQPGLSPAEVRFALHHEGLTGPDLSSPRLSPPSWWRELEAALKQGAALLPGRPRSGGSTG